MSRSNLNFVLGLTTSRAFYFPRYSDYEYLVETRSKMIQRVIDLYNPSLLVIDLSHQSFVFPVRRALDEYEGEVKIYSPFVGILETSIISYKEQRLLESELRILTDKYPTQFVGDMSELEEIKSEGKPFIARTQYAQSCRDTCRDLVKDNCDKLEDIRQ